MFPSVFYQPTHQYHTPSRHASPDQHRQMPFTVASVDAYDLVNIRAPHAYAHAEASVLQHLQRQAELEALHAREREMERQRRLAHIAALEEAQHRQYHQQAVIDAYLQAQARARAQAEAERQQRERQREYQERAIQRERAERAYMQEIECRRAEARQRIFVDDLFETLFSDGPRELEASPSRQPQVQPRFVPPQVQPRVVPRVAPQVQAPEFVIQGLVPPQVASHAALHDAQRRHAPPQSQHREVRPQPAHAPVHHSQARPAIAPNAAPAPTTEQEAFENFLSSFFGVSAPQFSRTPVPATARQPAASSPVVKAQPQAKKSVEFSQPPRVPEIVKPAQIAQPEPSAPTTSTPRAVKDSAHAPEPQQSDDLTNLLSTVFGVPFVRRVDEEKRSPIPVAEKRAKTDEAVRSPPAPKEMPPAPPMIERPPSPAPPDDVSSRPTSESQEPEEVSEEFKRMVDKVFKDLEKAFGVPAEAVAEGGQSVAEGKKPEPIPASSQSPPSKKEPSTGLQIPTTIESPTPATKPSAPPAPAPQIITQETKDQPMEESIANDQSLDSASATTFEEGDDDDVPASAAELQSEKAQSAATLIQQKYRRHLARVQRLEKLEVLKAKLAKLESGFTFPEHLDFQNPDSGLTTPSLDPVDGASHDGDERVVPVPALAFTHNNAPYHAHAQALLALLVSADAISSDGDQEVRKVRKDFVKEVEEQLADMERKRSDVWKKQQAAKPSDKAQQDSHATTPRDVEMEVKASQATDDETTDARDESDTKMASPPTEYVEPETPKAVEPQSALESTTDTSIPEVAQTESATPGEKTSVEPILAKEVLGIDPDVFTAPESEFIEPESSTENKQMDVASQDTPSQSKSTPEDAKDSTSATLQATEAKETTVASKRPPKAAVEDASDVDMARSYTGSSVASETPQ
ncbi:hypothetical protein QFC21_001893 [Naganishia friedmannii]|uniref:Uncharacterized protein n=1 Tax=Naganishia friedmannii TaxID=89922 RepID=A0ACC2W352_9TREE|nr:hypothetical protein QFC21_001893 [Naganishia friedmannii]